MRHFILLLVNKLIRFSVMEMVVSLLFIKVVCALLHTFVQGIDFIPGISFTHVQSMPDLLWLFKTITKTAAQFHSTSEM